MKSFAFGLSMLAGLAAGGAAWACGPEPDSACTGEVAVESPEQESAPGVPERNNHSHSLGDSLEDAPEFSIKAPLVTLAEARVYGGEHYHVDIASIPLLQGAGGSKGDKQSQFVDIPVVRLLAIDARGDVNGGDGTLSLQAGELLWADLFSAEAGVTPVENGATLEVSRWKLLDGGLATLAAKEKTPDGWEFDLGRVLWARLWENGVDGEATFVHLGNKLPGTVLSVRTSPDPQDEQYTKLLKFPFVSLAEYEHDGEWARRSLLDVTLASLYKAERNGDGAKASVLNLPLGTSLLRTETDAHGGRDVRFLKLPILGSLYGRTSDGDGASRTKVLFLPLFRTD